MLNLLWKFFYAIGHIFIVTNGQIWKILYNHLVTLIVIIIVVYFDKSCSIGFDQTFLGIHFNKVILVPKNVRKF